MADDAWLIGAVGDVFIDRDDPSGAFGTAAPALAACDLLIGNCEGAFTDHPEYAPSASWRVVSGTRNAAVLGPAGFDVLTCANNHTLDAGYRGLADTLAALRSQGIATCGAGANLREANAPALIERHGHRIAVLSYASVYQSGYGARDNGPGIATMRVHSHYYFPDWDESGRIEPGARPHVRTFAYPEDVTRLERAIAVARREADLVIAAFHWGSAWKRGVLLDYERELAYAAADAGADLILGHHHHFLRGVEFRNGRPIFYGLGHFVFDLTWIGAELGEAEIAKLREAYGDYAIYPRDGYPLLPFHPDARLTMIAVAAMRGRRIDHIGFVPCIIDPANQAIPVDPASPEGQAVIAYVRSVSEQNGFATDYRPGGPKAGPFDSVLIAPAEG